MKNVEHAIVGQIKTDADGVWRDDVKEFQSRMKKIGVWFTYSDPGRKEGGTESNVNIYEQTVKAILLERNMPGQAWGQAMGKQGQAGAFSGQASFCYARATYF